MRAVLLAAVAVGAACTNTLSPDGGTGPNPPLVQLSSDATVVIAPTLKLRASVSGCAKVKGLEIRHKGQRLITFEDPAQPFTFELLPSQLDMHYPSAGIAANLILTARAQCDDGRENTSTGLSLQFFPVESVVGPAMGNSTALPDAFVAEGGTGGTPTTFLGCVGLASGKTTIARFDTGGNVVGINNTPPLDCSYAAVISAKNPATGIRWLLEPGKGLFAFDSRPTSSLDIPAHLVLPVKLLGVGPDGDALTFESRLPAPVMHRVSRGTGGTNYETAVNGIMIGDPVVSQNEVRVVTWDSNLGSQTKATVNVSRYNYATGLKLGEVVLATLMYGELDVPKPPVAIFSPDGKVVYFAYTSVALDKTVTSSVSACASDSATGCNTNMPGNWQSPALDTLVGAAVPFANGTMIAAVGNTRTYFLNAADGKIVGEVVKPGGGMATFAAQPGNVADFYLLNGPSNADYPTEVVAIDSVASGELWRLQLPGGGQSPLNALNLAVDDGNNAWLRVGQNLVKPSTLAQYRARKGANLPSDGGD